MFRFLLVFCLSLSLFAQTSTYTGASTETVKLWQTAENWDPSDNPPNNNNGGSYDVIINRSDVHLSEGVIINSLDLNQGAAESAVINGGGQTLQVLGDLTSQKGFFDSSGILTVNGTTTVTGSLDFSGWMGNLATVDNQGGSIGLQNGAQITIDTLNLLDDAGASISADSQLIITNSIFKQGDGDFPPFSNFIGPVVLNSGAGITSELQGNLSFTNLSGGDVAISLSDDSFYVEKGSFDNLAINFGINGGFAIVRNDVFNVSGSFSTSGSGYVAFFATGVISAGSLNAGDDAPFSLDGATVMNTPNFGAFDFRSGTASGMSNFALSDAPFNIGLELNQNPGTPTFSGSFDNNGTMISHKTFQLATDASFTNQAAGELFLKGGAFKDETNATGTSVSNLGEMLADTTSSVNVTTDIDNESGGVLGSIQGRLDLSSVTLKSGSILRIEEKASATVSPSIRLTASSSIQGSVSFEASGTDAIVEINGNGHNLTGVITGTGHGTALLGGQLNIFGIVGALDFPATFPFKVNHTSNGTSIDGSLANRGTMFWEVGHLGNGSTMSQLDQRGDFLLENHLYVEDDSVFIQRDGSFTFEPQTSVTLDDGAVFEVLGGSVALRSNCSFLSPVKALNNGVTNRASMIKSQDGGAHSFNAPYTQDSTTSLLQSSSGSILLYEANLLGGQVIGPLPGQGEGIYLRGPTTIRNQGFGGAIFINQGIHHFTGSMNATDGEFSLGGGELLGTGTLNFEIDGVFKVKGGRLGDSGMITNTGNLDVNSGMVNGTLDNQSNLTFNGGRMDGTFTNSGVFSWYGGELNGSLTNTGNPGLNMFSVARHDLLSNSTITNQGKITIFNTASLGFGENSVLDNQSRLDLDGGGLKLKRFSSAINGAKLINSGELNLSPSSSALSILLKIESSGSVNVNLGQVSLDAPSSEPSQYTPGNFNIVDEGFLTLENAALVSAVYNVADLGTMVHGSGIELSGTLLSQNTSKIHFISSTTINNSLLLRIKGGASFEEPAFITLNGILLNSDKLVTEGATFNMASGAQIENFGDWETIGNETVFGGGAERTQVTNIRQMDLQSGLVFYQGLDFVNQGRMDFIGSPGIGLLKGVEGSTFTNHGLLTKSVTGTSTISSAFSNPGKVVVVAGGLSLNNPGTEHFPILKRGIWIIEAEGSLDVGGDITNNEAAIFLNGGSFNNLPGMASSSDFINSRTLEISGTNATYDFGTGTYLNTGTTALKTASSSLRVGNFNNLGILKNSGTVEHRGSFTNSGTVSGNGTIRKIDSRGASEFVNEGKLVSGDGLGGTGLTVEGNLSQAGDGEIVLLLGGSQKGSGYAPLVVTGTANLDGTIRIVGRDGYIPQPGDSFELLQAGDFSGSFTGVTSSGSFQVTEASGMISLTVDQAPQSPDLNDDGILDLFDLVQIVSSGGACPSCIEDLDGNDTVDDEDLRIAVSNWLSIFAD